MGAERLGRSALPARILALVLGMMGAAGCSTTTDEQPYAGICSPLRALDWTPAAGTQSVARDTMVRVRFNDYPDPETVNLEGFIVTTGLFRQGGTMRLDIVDKTITFEPSGAWRADLGYNINVRAGLLSLQGCAAAPEQHSFRTATAPPQATMPPAPTTYAAVRPIFAARCAGGACHRATTTDGGGCLAEPAQGLSLCDAEVLDALVDVPSRQVSRLHLVEPRDSGRSYLIRKLLPGDSPERPAPSTLGHRDPPGAPLSLDEIRTVARWVDDGPVL